MPVTRLDPSRSLAVLVGDHPGLARSLDARALDYCCAGHRSLAAACAEVGLDVGQVVAELTVELAGTTEVPTSAREPGDLADLIEATHHAAARRDLARLEVLAARVDGVHGGRHPELAVVAASVVELRADMEPHMAREERVLLPAARRLSEGVAVDDAERDRLARVLDVLVEEHRRVGALLARLRSLTFGYTVPEDACGSFRALYDGLLELEADTHVHVHLENARLIPAVAASAGLPAPR